MSTTIGSVLADVLGYLNQKNIPLKHAGGHEYNTTCFFCGEDPSKRGRLYINTDPDGEILGAYKCLAGETRVLTWDGYRPIRDLAGQTHKIMTEGGRWVEAPFLSFGTQKLMKLTLRRSRTKKVIYATPDHRWFVRKPSGPRLEVTTDQLKEGQPLCFAYGQGVQSVRPSAFGVAWGSTFGDGTLTPNGSGCLCCFDVELHPYFSLSPRTHYSTCNGVPFSRFSDLPRHFKRLPDLDDSRSFLYGWLAGYFAADGSITKEGHPTLWSADKSNLEYVELLCSRIGIGTFGVRGPYYGKGRFNDEPMYGISFLRSTLTEEFFILSRHRKRFSVPKHERKSWRVVSVEETDRFEEVYCATVDGWGSFVIEGNILTGNCHRCDAKGNLITLRRHFGDDADSKPSEEVTARRSEILQAAADYYHDQLSEYPPAFGYLRGPRRGLELETIVDQKLGYAPANIASFVGRPGDGEVRNTRFLYEHLREMGYERQAILDTGLCRPQGNKTVDSLAGMVTIPYFYNGSVVSIRGRSWPYDDDDWASWEEGGFVKYQPPPGKYKTCGGDSQRLYNVDAIREVDEVVVCEGEADSLVVAQLGLPAVGAPGAKSWQDSWDYYFTDVKRIWLLFDRDEAGEKGAAKIEEKFGPKVRRIELSPEGTKFDPTDWVASVRAEGLDPALELAKKMAESHNPITWIADVDQAIAEFNEYQGQPGMKFGWELLDLMIDPGMQPSQLMIPLAKTGCITGDAEVYVMPPSQEPQWVRLDQLYEEWKAGVHSTVLIDRSENGMVRWGEVEEVWDSGIKPVFTVSTEQGRSITATKEHPFHTPKGWKKLGELELDDEVFVAGESSRVEADVVTSIASAGQQQTYDISMADEPHNFIANGFVVHNTGKALAVDELVATPGGDVPIGSLAPGDFVIGADGPTQVLGVFPQGRRELVRLTFSDGSVVVCDWDHLWTFRDMRLSASGTWRTATTSQMLAAWNVLIPLQGGGYASVREVEPVGSGEAVCIKVDAADELFMLSGGVMTHNTVWCLNMMHRIRMVPGQANMKMLFVSLEQTRGEWWDRARRIHRFYNLDSTEQDARDWWFDNIVIADKNKVAPDDFMRLLDDFDYRMGGLPDLIVVDYLGYFSQGFRGERYERVSDAVMWLKGMVKETKTRVIVPHQVSRVGKDGQEFGADAARDSVVGSTLVQLADGSRRTIESLVDTQPELVVLGNDFKFRTRKAERVWKKGERDVFKVTLKSGRTITCTDSHPFFTIHGWERLSDLGTGSSVATPRDIPVFGNGAFPHAQLVGMLIADGGLTTTPVSFTKGEAELRELCISLAQEAGAEPTIRADDERQISLSAGGGPNPLTDYLRSIGAWGVKSPERRVPQGIWTASQEDIALFIRGAWSCDGSVKAKSRELTYSSSSRGLAEDLRTLLLRFGIRATISTESYSSGGYVEGKYFVLHVQGSEQVDLFAEWIGLDGEKGRKLNLLAGTSWNPSKYDSLPSEIWDHIHAVRKRKGLAWAETFGSTGVDERRRLSRSRALRIAENLHDPWLDALANGHLSFEEVESIEPAGREDVYDISVVGLHNFVANDIVVKNSGVVEETGDFVLPLWSPDNSLDRNEAEKSGKIHARIAKSRHGGRGVLLGMQWAPLSLAMVPEGDPLGIQARREFMWRQDYADNWYKAVYRHTTGHEGHIGTQLEQRIREGITSPEQLKLIV